MLGSKATAMHKQYVQYRNDPHVHRDAATRGSDHSDSRVGIPFVVEFLKRVNFGGKKG